MGCGTCPALVPMNPLRVQRIDSAEDLRALAPAWDRLWEASEVTLPTVRAEAVAQWIEHFAPKARQQILLVWHGQELAAALPLVGRRVRGLLPVGDLPSNCWSASGELLLDPAADAHAVMHLLASALDQMPWPLIWLDYVPIEAARWQGLVRALAEHRFLVDVHPRYRIGQVAIASDFNEYLASRSKNLQRSLHKDRQRLEQIGRVTLRHRTALVPAAVESSLREVFEVEARSWKRRSGRTVLDTPGMVAFYGRLAEQLAQWGCLNVAFLDLDGTPIAAELGWTAKGVYHSFKVAYDRAYRQYGPGQLLRRGLLEQFHANRGVRVVDFQGPMSAALAAWSTHSYAIGRIVIAPARPTSRLAFVAYRMLATAVRGLRKVARVGSATARRSSHKNPTSATPAT